METAPAVNFTSEEKFLFLSFMEQHEDIARTRENAAKFRAYLMANNLRCTLKNLDVAYQAIKGTFEIVKSQRQLEQERIEQIRQVIYEEVNQRLAPAKIDFTNPLVLSKIATWLHDNEKGLMSTDRVLRAVHVLRFEPGFWEIEPAGLAKNKRNEQLGYDDSRTEHGIQGRRNHAEDVIDRESTERTKKLQEKLKDDESRVIGKMLFEDSIDSYVAVRNGRISVSQTEAIKKALRKFAEKHGSSVLSLIRSMPDDDSTETYIRKRI